MVSGHGRGHPPSERALRWALSPLDGQAHLLVPAGDLPWGVLQARCGALLPTGVARQHERPPAGAHRSCPTCAQIARSPVSVPATPWVPNPQATARGQPDGAGARDTLRVAWARCPVEQHLHLLTARAILDLASKSCALACCGTLILTPTLVLRGSGPPCGQCLIAGRA